VYDFSIIIPTYNGAKSINACLESIFIQNFQKQFEVIVVDSSNDCTPEIIRQNFPQVNLICLKKQTPEGAARNIGIGNARGDIIVMTDQDCIVNKSWLSDIDKKMKSNNYDVIGGSITSFGKDSLWGLISYFVEFSEFMPQAKAKYKKNVPTCNIAYRKKIFSKKIRFPEDFPISEDMVMNYALVNSGRKIFFDPCISVEHINRQDLKAVLSHQFYIGRGSARARKRLSILPGAFLVKYPILITLMPFYRLLMLIKRLASYSKKLLFQAIILAIPILLIEIAWCIGFANEMFKKK